MKKLFSLLFVSIFFMAFGAINISAEEIAVNEENLFEWDELSLGDRKSFEFEISEEGTYDIKLLFDNEETAGTYSIRNRSRWEQVDGMEIWCKSKGQTDYSVFLEKGKYAIDFFCVQTDKTTNRVSGVVIVHNPTKELITQAHSIEQEIQEDGITEQVEYKNPKINKTNQEYKGSDSSIIIVGIVSATIIIVVGIICLTIYLITKKKK